MATTRGPRLTLASFSLLGLRSPGHGEHEIRRARHDKLSATSHGWDAQYGRYLKRVSLGAACAALRARARAFLVSYLSS